MTVVTCAWVIKHGLRLPIFLCAGLRFISRGHPVSSVIPEHIYERESRHRIVSVYHSLVK